MVRILSGVSLLGFVFTAVFLLTNHPGFALEAANIIYLLLFVTIVGEVALSLDGS